jgi:hypothetical protein
MDGLKRLLQSSKAWVVAVAMAGVTLLTILGRVTSIEALDAIKWLAITFIGATALEDSARKFALPPKAEAHKDPPSE